LASPKDSDKWPSNRVEMSEQNKGATIAYLSVATFVFALTAIGYLPARDFYRRFIGDVNPLIAISGCILLGLTCLLVVTHRGWLSIFVLDDARRALPLFALAAFLPLVAIVIDLFIHFPKDMNQ